MSAGLKEATVFGRTQGMVLSILEIIAGKASGVRGMVCATAGHAMAASVNRLQTAKENVKRPHLDLDTYQILTARSMHLLLYI